MKIVSCGMGLAVALMSPLALASAPKEVEAPVDRIFVPAGFDDNDNVEVVVHGDFMNSCYRVGRSGAKINLEKKVIEVWATALDYAPENGFEELCLQVTSPFIQTVKLGLLPEGDYDVVLDTPMAKEVSASLTVVKRKTEAPDDYLYAPVSNAYIDSNVASEKQALVLQGTFPVWFIGCQVMKEVRTYRSAGDVLVVQPITEIVDDARCDEAPANGGFVYRKGLSEPFQEEGLLHVRVMNGDSLNRYHAPSF